MMEKPVKKTLSLPAEISLVSKKNSLAKAEKILNAGEIDRMTLQELAEEIYFHACITRISKPLAERNIPGFTWVYQHADPIDLASGGDTPLRKIIFRIYWLLPEIR